MSDNVFWVLEVTIKLCELDNFKTLMNDMVDATMMRKGKYDFTMI